MPAAFDYAFALHYDLAAGVDYGDFRFGGRAEGRRLRIDVRAIDATAVGRERQVGGAAAGEQTLGLDAARQVDDRDIVAHAVGDVEEVAFRVGEGGVGLVPRRQFAEDFQGFDADDGDGVAPGVGDVEEAAIGGEGDAFGVLAYADAAADGIGDGIDFDDFVGAFADYVEAVAGCGDG